MTRTFALKTAGISALLAGSMATFGAGNAAATTSCNAAPTTKDFSAKYTNSTYTAAQVSYVGSLPMCEGKTQAVSFNSYLTEGATWPTSGKQRLVDHQTVQLSSTKTVANITVQLPADCYFQTDVYLGSQRFDGTAGNGSIPKYPDTVTPTMLLAAKNGGSKVCPAPTPTPTPTATPTPTPTPVATPTPTPVATPTPTPMPSGSGAVLGATLPVTGANELMAVIGTTSMLGMTAAYIRSRRK